MFSALKNWLETHPWRSNAGIVRKERRDTRRLGRLITKDIKAGEKIEEAFLSGKKEHIDHAFLAYTALLRGEVKTLRTFIIGYKALLTRAIDSIERLEQDIKMNAHESHKEDLLKDLAQMEAEILTSFKNFFVGLTSFENTNFSTQRLLDRASQARDLYYQAVQLRAPVRDLARWIKREDGGERAGKPVDIAAEKKSYATALAALKTELTRQSQGLKDVFLLLQEIQADIGTKLQLIASEVEKERYPAAWAQRNRTEIQPLQAEITDLINNEVKESRITLSDIERAQG